MWGLRKLDPTWLAVRFKSGPSSLKITCMYAQSPKRRMKEKELYCDHPFAAGGG